MKYILACGTAVIVTPIKSITKGEDTISFGDDYEILSELYEDVRGIQTGEKEDKYGWYVFNVTCVYINKSILLGVSMYVINLIQHQHKHNKN